MKPSDKRKLALDYSRQVSDRAFAPLSEDELVSIADHYLAGINMGIKLKEDAEQILLRRRQLSMEFA